MGLEKQRAGRHCGQLTWRVEGFVAWNHEEVYRYGLGEASDAPPRGSPDAQQDE